MKLALATLWILVGGAATAAVYWGFLITPESTVWALILSAILAIATLAVAGLTINGAILISTGVAPFTGSRRAIAMIPAVIPAAIVVLIIWWITNRIETWVTIYSGQINAWFIARLGWDNVSWLFNAIRYGAIWLRWVVAGLLALSLMSGLLSVGWRALAQLAWIRRAISPSALLVATLSFVALVVLPWVYLVPWRPRNLPASSTELVFIVVKLSIAAVLIAVGAALMVRAASRVPNPPTDPLSSVLAA